MALPIGTSC